MTRISSSQLLGDRGETEVLQRLTKGGWVGGSIRKDFGEDLCFQTFFEKRKDAHRIFVQVKSFYKKPKNVRISSTHAKNWLGMADIFYIFVYCSNENKVYWIPFEEFTDPVSIILNKNATISIPNKCFLDLDGEKVLSFIEWHARFEALQKRYMTAVGKFSMYKRGNRPERRRISEGYEFVAIGVLRQFLRLFSIDFKVLHDRIEYDSEFMDFVLGHSVMVSDGMPLMKGGTYFEELCLIIEMKAFYMGIDIVLMEEFFFLIRDHAVIYLMTLIKEYLISMNKSAEFIPDLPYETEMQPIFCDM